MKWVLPIAFWILFWAFLDAYHAVPYDQRFFSWAHYGAVLTGAFAVLSSFRALATSQRRNRP